jgi:hypothetical protein
MAGSAHCSPDDLSAARVCAPLPSLRRPDDDHGANAALIGADDETGERFTDPGANRLDAVLPQLLDQGVLLLFVHQLRAHGVHSDGDIACQGRLNDNGTEQDARDCTDTDLLHGTLYGEAAGNAASAGLPLSAAPQR